MHGSALARVVGHAQLNFWVGLVLGRLIEATCGALGVAAQVAAAAVAWSLATHRRCGLLSARAGAGGRDFYRNHGGSLFLSWGLVCGMGGFAGRCRRQPGAPAPDQAPPAR